MAGKPGRGGAVTAIAGAGRTLGDAVDAFLPVPRPATTARTYAGTLERLADRLGRDRPLPASPTTSWTAAAAGSCGAAWRRAPGTGTSPPSARSSPGAADHGWPAGNLHLRADRRAGPRTTPKAIPLPELERLWGNRISRCASGRCGGCCTTPPPAPRKSSAWTCPTSTWPTGRHGRASRAAHTHRCTSRPPPPGCCEADRGPRGRARCSSPSAAPPPTGSRRPPTSTPEAGGPGSPTRWPSSSSSKHTTGKTLHQLRHSRLTHLGEQNVNAPLLMAISGHKQLATLQQYVRPSQEAVAKLMADTDPDRRRR